MEMVSQVHRTNLVSWAKDKPNVVVLSADLTGSVEVDLFRDTYPDRFFSMGMAEQNMLSFAGGLAREGLIPLVHTFGVFIYRRALDQLSMSIAYPNLPVRMFGFLPGITTPGGATHQATDDIAILRAIPNLTILECGDATDVESVLEAAHGVPGPVYVRMLRGEIPRLFDRTFPMKVGSSRLLSEGREIALFTSGICTEEAIRATSILRSRGVSIEHRHITTHKPFSDPAIRETLAKVTRGVITFENHTTIGGLGSSIAETMAETGCGRKLVRLGLQDTYAHGASRPYLMREYGFDALSLVHAIEKLMQTSFGLTEADLAAVRIEAVHSDKKAEAL